jgi:hypothetical protein
MLAVHGIVALAGADVNGVLGFVSAHIDTIDLAPADIRADEAKNTIYIRPGKRDDSMLGKHAVSVVHGPTHYAQKEALLYTEGAMGPGSLGDFTVKDSMAAGLTMRLFPVTRRRRRQCYTEYGYRRRGNRPQKHNGNDCKCAYHAPNNGNYRCMLPTERKEYAFRTLKTGDVAYTLPMFASNEPDNSGLLPSEGGDYEFLGQPGHPFKISAADGTPCKTVEESGGHGASGHTVGQGCMSMPEPKRLSMLDEVRPGAQLFFWNEDGQYARAIVDTVKPDTADNKDEWSPGDTTIIFKAPFACEGGVACSFGKHSWVSVVPQFKALTVPKSAVLTAAQGVCGPPSNPTTCFNEPPLLVVDVASTLRVDGAIDMTGTASQCLDAPNATSRGNFGVTSCGAGGFGASGAGMQGGANPSSASVLRPGSCGGSGAGAEARCWKRWYTNQVLASRRRRRVYYTVAVWHEGWGTRPNQAGRCKWRSTARSSHCNEGTVRPSVFTSMQQNPAYGPDFKTEADWDDRCQHNLGFGGDGGVGGGVIVVSAKSITGSGRITSNGELGAPGQPKVVDIDPSSHYSGANHGHQRPGCKSEKAGGNGGAGSGGAVILTSSDVDVSVLITATPGGKVLKKSAAAAAPTTAKEITTTTTTTTAPAFIWVKTSESSAYCSYCTSCRFRESSEGTIEGNVCNAGDAPVAREASIAGGGCGGHCGCNVHNRIDYKFECRWSQLDKVD